MVKVKVSNCWNFVKQKRSLLSDQESKIDAILNYKSSNDDCSLEHICLDGHYWKATATGGGMPGSTTTGCRWLSTTAAANGGGWPSSTSTGDGWLNRRTAATGGCWLSSTATFSRSTLTSGCLLSIWQNGG